MAGVLDAFDWTSTAIGPPDQWPADLRAQVHLALDARIPMMLGWGPDFHLIYNDGYIPILGDKHPAVWQTGPDAFRELWGYVGPILDEVYRSGRAVMMENALLPLARRGFLEARYFTFSYSPLRDSAGKVVGVLSAAVETTLEVLASRRETLLATMAEPVAPATPADAVARAARALTDAADVPCHLVVVRSGADWTIASTSGFIGPAQEDIDEWVAALLLLCRDSTPERPVRCPIADVPGLRLASDTCGASHVAIIPFAGNGAESDGITVLGTHPMLYWDDAFASFCVRVSALLSGHYNAQRLRTLTIAEAEDRYHQLFMQALDGIILGKPTGEILAANPAACRILGYTEAELLAGGRSLVQDDADPRWRDGLVRRAETGEFTGELSWIHKAGHRVPCEVTSRTYEADSGEMRSTVVLRDISDRLLLQAQLAEAQKLEVVGRVSGGIAHDFNNLLAVIDIQADLLRHELRGNHEALADLDLLGQTSRRAAALIRRLLDFTKRSQGEPRTFNPAVAITEMASLLRRLVGPGCELTFHLEEGVPDVRMSPHQFEQVLFNLVVNARDAVEATGRSGVVEVQVEPGPGEQVRLVIRDDGVGIPEQIQPRIFDAFYTTKDHGTGIGLNTVKYLAEEMGGSVSIESAPGVGSVFTVCLPAWTTEEPTDAPAPAAATAVATRLDGVRVLLVEDQIQLRTVLTKVLRRAGAEVVTASNGEEAIRLAQDSLPDVLVSDVVMPLVSGSELVRSLRAIHPDLAIVLMSGYAGEEILPKETLAGITFLDKPFAVDVLVQAIHDLLPRNGSG